MSWTRRAFLQAAALGAAAVRLVAAPPPRSDAARRHEGPALLSGDPYLARTDAPGLGGRSFAQAREHALRFRTPGPERDRLVLGLGRTGA